MNVAELLDDALASGDDRDLRARLVAESGLPGPRMNLAMVDEMAAAVGRLVPRRGPSVDALEALLDGWAAITVEEAPGDRPEVILPCVAVASYGEVGAVRSDWWPDEVAKLRRAAADPRWRVREIVAQALQRLLDADWRRAMGELWEWTADGDPLVLRAVAAAVAEPRLLRDPERAVSAADLEHHVLNRYRAIDAGQRRTDAARTLRQALGYTLSVTAAATADLTTLEELSGSDDADLRWIARQNRGKARVRRLMTQE